MDAKIITMRKINNDIYIIMPNKSQLKMKVLEGTFELKDAKKVLDKRLVFVKKGTHLESGLKASCNNGECCAIIVQDKEKARSLINNNKQSYSYTPFEWIDNGAATWNDIKIENHSLIKHTFLISKKGKTELTAKNFYVGNDAKLPDEPSDFQTGLQNGTIKFAKKGTKITLQGHRYEAYKDIGNDTCYYAVTSDERSYGLLGGIKSFSRIPFEWQ